MNTNSTKSNIMTKNNTSIANEYEIYKSLLIESFCLSKVKSYDENLIKNCFSKMNKSINYHIISLNNISDK